MPKLHFFLSVLYMLLSSSAKAQSITGFQTYMRSVASVPLPAGYERITVPRGSFAAFLRDLPLRRNNTVYLYNGQPKKYQNLHYAVIDLSTGKTDLQQCADVLMRLRGEFFYAKKQFDSIVFYDGNRKAYRFPDKLRNCTAGLYDCFLVFMETVFANCGTYSLEKQLGKKNLADMKTADVLIKGGSPGHAQIVVDMAVNRSNGKKIFMLVEGYMPAQDAHIVLNIYEPALGPWFALDAGKDILTPTWSFRKDQLRQW